MAWTVVNFTPEEISIKSSQCYFTKLNERNQIRGLISGRSWMWMRTCCIMFSPTCARGQNMTQRWKSYSTHIPDFNKWILHLNKHTETSASEMDMALIHMFRKRCVAISCTSDSWFVSLRLQLADSDRPKLPNFSRFSHHRLPRGTSHDNNGLEKFVIIVQDHFLLYVEIFS